MYESYKEDSRIPMLRVGTPLEIAEPIAFLADNKASAYMTGQTMVVDGGVMLYTAFLGPRPSESP